jgi:magnesium and cobalt transporter
MSESTGWLKKFIDRTLGRSTEPTMRESITELMEEAAEASEASGQATELDRYEQSLIANVLRLRATTADDIMVPRADIVAMPIDMTLPQILQQMKVDGHSRWPVYREQLDDIAGFIHIKDVMAFIEKPDAFLLETILRSPLMVAPQMPVLDLLVQMRQGRMHMALVVDEYGGIDGLITIEDLVETIVGDIADEHDAALAPMVTERADGSLDIDGRMPIEDFETRMGKVLTDEEREADIDTVAGLVFTLAGRVPAKGEVLRHPSGLEFRILDVDGRRIRRVLVRRAKAEAA